MHIIDVGLLLLRVGMGLTLAAHGVQKLFGWFGGSGLAGTAAMFGRVGFSAALPSALAAGLGESCGGLLLAAGAATPLGSAIAGGTMIVAASTQVPKGFFVIKGGFEYPAMLAWIAGSLALTGPGWLSIDHAVGWEPATWLRLVAVAAAIITSSFVIWQRSAELRRRRESPPVDPQTAYSATSHGPATDA